MKVLVWQDHGQVNVLSGNLIDIMGKVLFAMSFSYSQDEQDYVANSYSEHQFEQRVKNTTTDDEQFEVFKFVDVKEI